MKGLFDHFGTAVLTLVLAVILAGCGTSAPTRFYTLSATVSGDPAPVADLPESPRIVVGVGTVDIPDYLDRPQIITRTSRHQLALSEFDLWGGSLKADVNRVLLENLTGALPPDRFRVLATKRGTPVDYRVLVTITRLDPVPEKGVILHAQWALAVKEGVVDGSFRNVDLTEPMTTKGVEGAVDAMSRVLARLSAEIAAQIEAVPQ